MILYVWHANSLNKSQRGWISQGRGRFSLQKNSVNKTEILKLSYFRIKIEDLRFIAVWGKLKAEMCALRGNDTFLSPPANERMS